MARATLVLGLLLLLGFASPVLADQDPVRWAEVNIPTQGKAGGWVLARGSDVQHPRMAPDGSLYAYGGGLTYTLYQSKDGGYSWQAIGKVKDEIIDIAIAPDNTVYYATPSQVYKSIDGVNKFIPLPSPGGADGITIEITSLEVSHLDNNIILVGTKDNGPNEYGGIYLLEDTPPFTWTNTGLDKKDVYGLAFSPNYPAGQIIAVVSDKRSTFVTTNSEGRWGEETKIAELVPETASIAFPEDYEPNIVASYFVALDDSGGEKGGVYRVERSVVTNLNIGVDITGLAVSGRAAEAHLIAGAAASAEVYLSRDGGRNWRKSIKPPTGKEKTCVLVAQGRLYAATSGDDSALSCSLDGGLTWNQISLIDTTITTIVDLAPSPAYSEDETLFMLTNQDGGKDSLWRSLDGGEKWERVLYGLAEEIDRVALPPDYSLDNQVVYLAGNRTIWKSTDNAQTFSRRAAPLPIDAWAIADSTTLFIGSHDFDDTTKNGLVYLSTNSGTSFSEGAIAGEQSLNSIAISPDYAKDKTLLVGNKDGWVFWSEDNGLSFTSLPQNATTAPLKGEISVIFDPEYSDNNTVYATSSTEVTTTDKERIYRFIIGKSDKWESIDSTLPVTAAAGSVINQLALSADGTLYAANSMADGGMERCLNPTYPLGPTFETVTRGLDDGVKLFGLWLVGNQLWSTDSEHAKLLTYIDSLDRPVTLTSPADEAAGLGMIVKDEVKNVSLDWETLEGATEYQWQLDYDDEFASVPEGFERDTRASSAQLPDLEPATTYYWRVRATKPVLSPWSDKWSFTTTFGTEAHAPKLESPPAGATNVPIKPIFQWSAIAGADSYELVVSTDPAVHNPTILKTGSFTLLTTAWQSNVELEYNTTYYWKVRAVSSSTYSPWSAVSAFTTEPALTTNSTPPELHKSSPDIFKWTEWLIPLGGITLLVFLLTMVMMLITMMILVIKILRL